MPEGGGGVTEPTAGDAMVRGEAIYLNPVELVFA